MGPIQQTQFAFVLLNRARLHHVVVARRAHADRGEVSLKEMAGQRLEALTGEQTRSFESVFRAIRKQKLDEKVRSTLKDLLLSIFRKDLKSEPEVDPRTS